jgi:hypothetical protein
MGKNLAGQVEEEDTAQGPRNGVRQPRMASLSPAIQLALSLVGPGEEQWTFGQMLALVGLVVHGVELVKMLCIWKVDRGGRGRESRGGSRSPIQLELRDRS